MQWLSARDNSAPQENFNNIWSHFWLSKDVLGGVRGAGTTITEAKDVVCTLHSILMHKTTTRTTMREKRMRNRKKRRRKRRRRDYLFWIKDINNDTGGTDSGSNWGNFNIMNIQW